MKCLKCVYFRMHGPSLQTFLLPGKKKKGWGGKGFNNLDGVKAQRKQVVM